ncbi:ubiquilin-1-like [Dromaius novaehollandiae]|uniref:ubiquilin-1-like n=1 Tax=Dromaius novaehollandiae TaxID=8790 RepID=UPI00311FD160
MDVPGAAAPPTVRVTVKTPQQKEEFAVPVNRCIREFRGEVSVRFSSPISQLVLVFAGRILKDHKTLSEYGIHDEATVYLVVHSQRGSQDHLGRQTSSSQGAFKIPAERIGISGPETRSSSAFNAQDLQGLLNSIGLNTVHLPEFQSQLLSTTDMTFQLLENLLIESMLSSPELIQKLCTDSPLKQITIQKIPQISHFLSTPDSLILELARSPVTVREIMRNPKDTESCLGSLLGGDNPLQLGNAENQGLRQRATLKQPGGQLFAPFRSCSSRDSNQSVLNAEIREPFLKAHPLQPNSHSNVSNVLRTPGCAGPGLAVRPEEGSSVVMLVAVRRLLEQIIKQILQDILFSLSGRGRGHLPSQQPDTAAKQLQNAPAVGKTPQRQPQQQVWTSEAPGTKPGSQGMQVLVQVLQTLQKLAAEAGVTPQLVCLLEGLVSLSDAGGTGLPISGLCKISCPASGAQSQQVQMQQHQTPN